MKNYAGVDGCDDALRKELSEAGIEVGEFYKNFKGEVPTKIYGTVGPWGFKRAWNYWVADGPGIPPEIAEELHTTHGKEVRVDGNACCPSPKEWFKGFAVSNYHIDTQEGLKALADTIKRVMAGSQQKSLHTSSQ